LHVVNRNSEQLVDCLPIEGEYYIIVANQENSVKNNGRIKASSYIVSSSENITHLKLLNEEEFHTNKDVKRYVNEILKSEETQNPDTPFLVIEDGGGGVGTGSSGNSFSDAIELSDGINMYAYLSSGDEKYFKFYSDNIDGVLIQSTYTSSQLDVKAYMYDDFYSLLTVDNDSGDYSNFLINYQTSAGRYYYIKVQAANSSNSGSFNVRYDIDTECTCINSANNLVLGYDSVNINKNIIWKGSTQYDHEWNYSINQWNDEGYVTIKEDTWLLDATLDVDDYEDTSSGAYIAYFQNGNLFTDDKIRINTAKFDTMTSQERFKTLMHELGHALGIDEMNPATTSNPYGNENISVTESSLNVMVQGKRALTEIGPCDRNVLRYLWE
jgi:hypothetical protein